MKWTYSCPHCSAMLNPQDAIILVARYEDRVWLVGLHPEPGKYEIFVPPGVKVTWGDRWSFACPVCCADLVTTFSDDLCSIDIHTQDEDHRVFFSRIAGEQATFVINAEGLRSKHGKDAEVYEQETAQMKYLL